MHFIDKKFFFLKAHSYFWSCQNNQNKIKPIKTVCFKYKKVIKIYSYGKHYLD